MVTVGDIVGGGFRLIRERIGAIAIWGLLYLAMSVGTVFLLRPMMLEMAAGGSAANPALAMASMGKSFGVYLLTMIGTLILYCAALRAALRPEEDSFAYLRLGMDELRILLVALVMAVGFFLLYLGLSIPLMLIGGIFMVVARGAGVLVFVLLGLGVAAAMIFVYIRFSLVFALTMLRGRIVIGASWALTKGRFWTLFGAYFVTGLIVLAVSIVLLGFTNGSYISEMAHGGFTPQAIQAAQRDQMANQFVTISALTVVGWVLGSMFGILWIALSAGAVGTAAIGLLDDDFDDIAAIYE